MTYKIVWHPKLMYHNIKSQIPNEWIFGVVQLKFWLRVCLDITYFTEIWKFIIKNNKKIIFGLLFTLSNTEHLF